MNPRDYPWHERLLPERERGNVYTIYNVWWITVYAYGNACFHYHYIDGSIIHYFCHVFFSSIFCFISLYRTAKRRREVMMLRR